MAATIPSAGSDEKFGEPGGVSPRTDRYCHYASIINSSRPEADALRLAETSHSLPFGV